MKCHVIESREINFHKRQQLVAFLAFFQSSNNARAIGRFESFQRKKLSNILWTIAAILVVLQILEKFFRFKNVSFEIETKTVKYSLNASNASARDNDAAAFSAFLLSALPLNFSKGFL